MFTVMPFGHVIVKNSVIIFSILYFIQVLFGEALLMLTAGGELVDFGAYCVKRLCENDNISRTYMYKTGTHGPGAVQSV